MWNDLTQKYYDYLRGHIGNAKSSSSVDYSLIVKKWLIMRVKIFILSGFICALTSCATLKEKHIETAKKVLSSMQNGDSELINSMIALNADGIGLDVSHIKFDCGRLKILQERYGVVDVSKMKYVVNQSDFVTPYMVEFPLYYGEDTIWHRKVKGVSFRVFFGPENVNSPNKIAYYEIYLDGVFVP